VKNQIQKDKFKRNLNLKFENKRIILKSIIKNNNICKTIRWNSELKLTEINSNSHKNRLVNRCMLTGRKGKFNKLFRFSRLSFLKFTRKGFVSGLKKSIK
jgi:small subunit ribosomal protein S14